MSDTYTKLFSSITASTVWQEPAGTRLTWITMLAMVGRDGCVYASIPGLAHMANVPRDQVERALSCFLAPDPDSRTEEHEGRRIEKIDGGWRLLNHAKFSAIRGEVERAEYKRKWERENRPSGHARKSDSPTASPTDSDSPTVATTPAPAPAPTSTPTSRKSERNARAIEEEAKRTAEALTAIGCPDTHAHDARLLQVLQDGITPAELVALAGTKKGAGKSLAYLISTICGQRRDAEKNPQLSAQAAGSSQSSRSAEGERQTHAMTELENAIIDARHLFEISESIDAAERDRRIAAARKTYKATVGNPQETPAPGVLPAGKAGGEEEMGPSLTPPIAVGPNRPCLRQ